MRVTVNQRSYPMPAIPTVVICIDGCEPAYLETARGAGLMPCLDRILDRGTERLAHAAIPSFTNPNNLSIATGRPPSVHGISGNTFLDRTTGSEVMMNDPSFLRAPTLFSALHEAGARVAVVTAKDKLRALLGAGLSCADGSAVCFSAERAGETTLARNGVAEADRWVGMKQPDVYSATLSEFVLAAGVRLLRDWRPDLMYLTTTDFIQHKFAPGEAEADDFHAMVDSYLGEIDGLGAAMVVTADHGMNAKHDADGAPSVIHVQDLVDGWLGPGQGRVILPISDPYVVHHGSLGSFATLYLADDAETAGTVERLRTVPGIHVVLPGPEAARRFELPLDRIGDVVIVSERGTTLGSSRERHDLGALDRPLRSHGGLTEQVVPFIVNRRMDLPGAPELRNFDAFFWALEAAGLPVPGKAA